MGHKIIEVEQVAGKKYRVLIEKAENQINSGKGRCKALIWV